MSNKLTSTLPQKEVHLMEPRSMPPAIVKCNGVRTGEIRTAGSQELTNGLYSEQFLKMNLRVKMVVFTYKGSTGVFSVK
jgi:hypothetical protein